MTLEHQIEALLFYKNEPLEIKKISKMLEKNEKEVREALRNLAGSFQNRGVCLVMTETEAGLATAPGMNGFIEKVAKDEMNKEIGKAGLETLAIILYNGPISRREIDYIRGVNSTFILRNLCIRGLIEKEPDLKDQRILRYKCSLSLLTHLGLRNIEELPEFHLLRKQISESKDITEEKENDA